MNEEINIIDEINTGVIGSNKKFLQLFGPTYFVDNVNYHIIYI